MFTHTLKKLPKSTVEITINIPWTDIQAEYKKAFSELHTQLEIEGYRKGKVPEALAVKHIAKDAVYEHLLQTLLPRVYDEIVKKEGLKPIISPKMSLVKAKENEDWQIQAKVAEKPEVKADKYKEIVQEAKKGLKTDEIWVPGKETSEKPEDAEMKRQKLLNTILEALLKKVSIEISDVVIEDELNQRLSRLIDDIEKLGLTTETYLKSKNLTMEQLRAQYAKEIEDMYKLEFLLMDIADRADIKVEQKELDGLFSGIKDERERQSAQANAYFYATIIRKQKTLEHLTNL